MEKLSILFLIFFIYAIIGYICEVIYVYYGTKQWINRGFCLGPYIPIYGVGGIIIAFLLTGYYNDPIVVFVMSLIFCSSLEYFTSFLMEVIFQRRWWDYSDKKYNLNGRICLTNCILFGIGGLLIVYIVHPVISNFLHNIPTNKLNICSLILFFIFLIDVITSIFEAYRINNISTHLEKILNEYTKNKNIKLNKIKTRLFDAFPYLVENKRVLKRLKALKKDFMYRKHLKRKK